MDTNPDHRAELKPGCPICEAIGRIRADQFPDLIAELPETYVVLSEPQGCPGWCVLYLKSHASHFEELVGSKQAAIFADVVSVASAIRRALRPARINYACLCNQVAHVHWHVIPRHESDPDLKSSIWTWPEERIKGAMDAAGRAAMVKRLREAIDSGGEE